MEEKKKIQITRISLIALIAVVILAIGILSVILLGGKEETKPQENIIENKEENTQIEEPTKPEEPEIAKDPLPQIALNTIAKENATINGKVPCYYNPVIPKGLKP